MIKLNHSYSYDNLVVGSGLNALMFAYLNKYPIIINADKPPLPFEFFDSNFDLGQFGFEPRSYELNTGNGIVEVGLPRFEVWQKLFFVLSLSGLCPLSLKSASFRIQDDNEFKVVTRRSRVIKGKFGKLFVFDNENVRGLPFSLSDRIKKYKVVDWFNVRRGNKHNIDYTFTNDDFVKEIYFYKAQIRNAKDIAAISFMVGQQLRDVQYTDTFVKFKVLKIMKELGIRGTRNGKDVHDPSKYSYYLPAIEYERRDVIPFYDFSSKQEGDITFIALSEEEIAEDYKLQFPIDDYLYKTTQTLGGEIYLNAR